MIKVEHTKEHIIDIPNGTFSGNHVLHETKIVVEGKLVLVECLSKEAIFTKESALYLTKDYPYTGDFCKPIIISEIEPIEVGDWAFNLKTKQLKQVLSQDGGILAGMVWCKVLALSEHFSPEQLKMIVDGKLKDGEKVLVECEKIDWDGDMISGYKGKNLVPVIKLNSYDFATIHKPTLEKIYTREDIDLLVRKYLTDYSDIDWKEWFDQNVK